MLIFTLLLHCSGENIWLFNIRDSDVINTSDMVDKLGILGLNPLSSVFLL